MDPNEMITTETDLAELTEREYKVDASLPVDSPITSFYVGKTVFLTGPTGFLGHLLLEKLLRYFLVSYDLSHFLMITILLNAA